MRCTLDSNILVYAIDSGTADKHAVAFDLMARALKADFVLTVQALGEFLAVIRRKYPAHYDSAHAQAARWAQIFPVVPTEWSHISTASNFAARYRLQFWDCVIWQAARSAGASILVTEDLQDGLSLEGMAVVDPFKPGNRERLNKLIGG